MSYGVLYWLPRPVHNGPGHDRETVLTVQCILILFIQAGKQKGIRRSPLHLEVETARDVIF